MSENKYRCFTLNLMVCKGQLLRGCNLSIKTNSVCICFPRSVYCCHNADIPGSKSKFCTLEFVLLKDTVKLLILLFM